MSLTKDRIEELEHKVQVQFEMIKNLKTMVENVREQLEITNKLILAKEKAKQVLRRF